MTVMYHATPYENLINILDNGIKADNDGSVYLCNNSDDCVKFLAVRGIKHVVTFEVRIPKRLENRIFESFDHSQAFFKCRAFGFIGDIAPKMIKPFKHYDLTGLD